MKKPFLTRHRGVSLSPLAAKRPISERQIGGGAGDAKHRQRGGEAPAPDVERPRETPKAKLSRRGTNTNSLANLKRGGAKSHSGPTPTKDSDADVYVRLRASGVPPVEAVVFFAKGHETLTLKQWAACAREWETSKLTKDAWDRFNGGEWKDLDDETRIEKALAHHIAQCAYLLYTSELASETAPMGKLNYAKTTILAKLQMDKESGGLGDAFTDFLKQITSNAQATQPSVWSGKGDVDAFGDGDSSEDRGPQDDVRRPKQSIRRGPDRPH